MLNDFYEISLVFGGGRRAAGVACRSFDAHHQLAGDQHFDNLETSTSPQYNYMSPTETLQESHKNLPWWSWQWWWGGGCGGDNGGAGNGGSGGGGGGGGGGDNDGGGDDGGGGNDGGGGGHHALFW